MRGICVKCGKDVGQSGKRYQYFGIKRGTQDEFHEREDWVCSSCVRAYVAARSAKFIPLLICGILFGVAAAWFLLTRKPDGLGVVLPLIFIPTAMIIGALAFLGEPQKAGNEIALQCGRSALEKLGCRSFQARPGPSQEVATALSARQMSVQARKPDYVEQSDDNSAAGLESALKGMYESAPPGSAQRASAAQAVAAYHDLAAGDIVRGMAARIEAREAAEVVASTSQPPRRLVLQVDPPTPIKPSQHIGVGGKAQPTGREKVVYFLTMILSGIDSSTRELRTLKCTNDSLNVEGGRGDIAMPDGRPWWFYVSTASSPSPEVPSFIGKGKMLLYATATPEEDQSQRISNLVELDVDFDSGSLVVVNS